MGNLTYGMMIKKRFVKIFRGKWGYQGALGDLSTR